MSNSLAALKAVKELSYTYNHKIIREYEATHIENIIRAELGVDEFGFRKAYGKMKIIPSDAIVGVKDPDAGRFALPSIYRIDFGKVQMILVRSKTNYNYFDKNKNHYKLLKGRGIERKNVPNTPITQEYLDSR